MPKVTQWEFYQEDVGLDIDSCDYLGRDGWELVSVVKNGTRETAFFKRPLHQPKKK